MQQLATHFQLFRAFLLGKKSLDARTSPQSTVVFLCLLAVLCSGCAGGEDLRLPTYTPDESAKQALAEYDTNHDGFLDAKELERCPALKNNLDTMDSDGNQRLSAEEIAARIQVYQESQVALKAVACRVQLDGKPLQGASVTFVPEKFMGTSIRPASGVSDERGGVQLMVEGEKYPGAQPGLYRVYVSKKNASGQETIPARYNQDTTLGAEVYPRKLRRSGTREDVAGDFRLTSKPK
ncbi:MAG TPA: EF-hand domain-containing protein [Gemmataceae bacterium]|nr:EF-hand domain-containing protein [Gemmataceae bacterium]